MELKPCPFCGGNEKRMIDANVCLDCPHWVPIEKEGSD